MASSLPICQQNLLLVHDKEWSNHCTADECGQHLAVPWHRGQSADVAVHMTTALANHA
jgi:hypothetical protein